MLQVSGAPGSGLAGGRRSFEVFDDEALEIIPHRRRGRDIGLALGITGTALLPAGLAVFIGGLYSEMSDDCPYDPARYYYADDCEPDRLNPAIWIGPALVAIGAVLTPVGWTRYARRRSPLIYPAAPGAGAGIRGPRLALAASSAQFGLSLAWAF